MPTPPRRRKSPSKPTQKNRGKIPKPNLTPEFQFPNRKNISGLLHPHFERTNDMKPVIAAKIRGVKVGRLIYTTEVKRDRHRYWKLDLDVEKEYRKLGVAQYLIEQLIQHAQTHNQRFPDEKINALVADIDAEDNVSIALAHKMNFSQTGINFHGNRTKDNATLIFQYRLT